MHDVCGVSRRALCELAARKGGMVLTCVPILFVLLVEFSLASEVDILLS